MAIEIISKTKIKIPKSYIIFFSVCGVIFLGLLASYGYLYISSKDIKEKIVEKDLALIKKPPEKELENYIFSTEKKINDFENLFSQHKKIYNIFPLLQGFTHPEAQFTSFSFSVSGNKLDLKGITKNFYSLGQQILILKNEPKLKQVAFSGITLEKDGRVSFALSLIFDPEILK